MSSLTEKTDKTESIKLSQGDALLVESLRRRGWSDEELLDRVQTGNLPVDGSKFEFDYHRLTELQAEGPQAFEQAVKAGYQIKFNTIRGIRSWIEVALGKEAVLELEEGREAVEVELTAAERARLTAVLSYGWQVVGGNASNPSSDEPETVSPVRIEPVRH